MPFQSSSKGGRLAVALAALMVVNGLSQGSTPQAEAQSKALGSLPAPPSPTGMGEQVAAALYNRGMALYELGDIGSAKKLFGESLERSPNGSRAGDALAMLRKCNEKLGIEDRDAGRPVPGSGSDVPMDPYADSTADDGISLLAPFATADGPVDPYAVGATVEPPLVVGAAAETETETEAGALPKETQGDASGSKARVDLMVAGGLYGLIAGLALTGPFEDVDGESGDLRGSAVPVGLAVAGGGVFLGHYLAKKYDRAGGKALSSGALWGMYNFAHIGNILTGDETSGNDVYKSMALGGLAGGGLGHLYVSKLKPSEGEVAVANSGALIGTGAALMLGVAMDPPRGDAYSLNAALGSMAGLGAGIFFSDKVVASPKRMTFVTLGAAAGATVPWIMVYPFLDGSGGGDYQTAGFLSALSMGGGAYLVWRLTEDDESKASASVDALAPIAPALVQRDPGGRWSLATPMPRPMENHRLASRVGFSMGADVLSGRF
ncbi:MAG: hypothetical protein GY811_27260 [Myxococcales bacterium]|nr:hypothetical protein [Myxococcales bacterium]